MRMESVQVDMKEIQLSMVVGEYLPGTTLNSEYLS
jgi:hypothetical protein